MQGPAGYRQISSTIQEELATAERLAASLETERPLPGAKGGLFLAPAWERVMLWRPLVSRLEVEEATPSAEEQAELWREYEWTKAVQMRLPRRVTWYQLGFMVAVGVFAVAPFEVEAGDYQHLSDILPYLLASFWGIVGGCAASLWQLLREVEDRSLSASGAVSHFLRPYLGGVLGLLVSLILPANLLDIEGADINLTGYALAALAGLSERTFINKLQQLLEVMLGQAASARANGTATPVSQVRAAVKAAQSASTAGGGSTAPDSAAATGTALAAQAAATVASAVQTSVAGAAATPAALVEGSSK